MSWHCPLPFTSLSSETLGYYALCCESRPSPHHCQDMTFSEFDQSEYMTNVRNGFKSDDPMSVSEIKHACGQCKRKEDQGVVSKRQRELKHDDKYKKFMELKLIGNICNYACIMCAPNSSSKIAEEQGIKYPKWFELSVDWYNDFAEVAKQFNYFKFSGGEPFMSPTTNKILKILRASGRSKEIKLQFNTNGSASKKVIQNLLNDFDSVSICFSVDAWGDRNAAIRKHSSWEFTEDRLWDYAELASTNPNLHLSIHPCISTLNVGYIYEFYPFVSQFSFLKNLYFSVSNTLAWPDELNAIHLPTNIKEKYWKDNKDFLLSGLVSETDSVINILNDKTHSNMKLVQDGLKKVPGAALWYPELIN